MPIAEQERISNNYRSQLADETVSAAIKCLFACLGPQSPTGVLDQSLKLVRASHQRKTPTIDICVYDGQQQIVSKLSHEVKTKASENETEAEVRDEEKAAAWQVAAGASGLSSRETADETSASTSTMARDSSFWRPWQDLVLVSLAEDPQRHVDATESLRKSRISLAVAFVQSGIPNLQARGTLADLLNAWLQAERSRPLRSLLEEALQTNQSQIDLAQRPSK